MSFAAYSALSASGLAELIGAPEVRRAGHAGRAPPFWRVGLGVWGFGV